MKYELYDFNGTIYKGNLTRDVIIYVLRLYPKYFFSIILTIFLYVFKIIDKNEYKNRLYSFTKNINNIDDFVKKFWQRNEKKLNVFWLNKNTHKNDIIISDESNFVLNYISKKYKVAQILGLEYNFETFKFVDSNYNVENKVKEFYKTYPNSKINLYVYSKSLISINGVENMFYVQKGIVIPSENYKPSFVKVMFSKLIDIINNREIFCYLVAGILTLIVNLLVKWLLLGIFFNENDVLELQITVILSWLLAVIFAYFINRIYVFRSISDKKINEFIKFLGSRILTLLIEMFLTWIFITLCNLDVNVIIIAIQFIIIILNYIFSKIFIFKKQRSFKNNSC